MSNKKEICGHCKKHKKEKETGGLCKSCFLIPRCRKCTIILGYWNKNQTKLEYNQYNHPSSTKKTICTGCEQNIINKPLPLTPKEKIMDTINNLQALKEEMANKSEFQIVKKIDELVELLTEYSNDIKQ